MLAILQFDSPAMSLLETMLADGRLPTLAHLRRHGRWEELDPDAVRLQSSTYMSLCTGVDVAEHGIYSAFPWSSEEQRARSMYTFPAPPTIWERLTACGRRSLIIDPMLAWAPHRMVGAYLSGWQFEDRMVLRDVCLPSGLRRELVDRFGMPPPLHDVYGIRRVSTLLSWREHLLRAPGRAADAALHLLHRQPFDLLWLNFAAAHKAGHHFWDPAAVVRETGHDEDLRLLQEGLAEVYRNVDTAIGRILEGLPDPADVIVFSPTGMGANTSRADLLPGMLDAVLHGASDHERRRGALARSPIWWLRAVIPTALRERLALGLPDAWAAGLAARLYMRRDGNASRAIAVPSEHMGYVRINLKDREREGFVDLAEMDDLLTRIERGLLTFRDPDGLPSIARVERRSRIATLGAAIERLPDLVVHWGESPAARLSHVSSAPHGRVTRRGVGSGRSGNHVDDPWMILVPGRSKRRDIGRKARITDIGATACALLGASTSGLSGTSLLE